MNTKTILQIRDINKSSLKHLESIFKPINKFKDFVFWIRDGTMLKQIFTSDEYYSVWGRDPHILYQIPLLWLETLDRENFEVYMTQLQFRHDRNYQHRADNLTFYVIRRPDGERRYIRCQVIKCRCWQGKDYLMGISQNIPYDDWLVQSETKKFPFTKEMQDAYDLFFKLLYDNFGITERLPLPPKNQWQQIKEMIYHLESIKFSTRELQCIYYLCLGKTTKETSKELGGLSPRTVEDYLNNIRIKSKCANKLAIISRFCLYFRE